MSYARMQDAREMSRIDMTPFVGVLLVLLAFFLMPYFSLGRTTKLPYAIPMPLDGPPDSMPIHLALAADGQIYWDQHRISEVELDARLAQLGSSEHQVALQVFADDNVSYAALSRVITEADDQGVRSIDVISDPELDGYR